MKHTNTITRKHISTLLAAIAALGATTAYAGTYVDVDTTATPAAWSSNSSDSFATTSAYLSNFATGITPTPASVQAGDANGVFTNVQSTFDTAVSTLNGAGAGSAANYLASQTSYNDLLASGTATEPELNAALQARNIAQGQYQQNLSTVNNFSSVVNIAPGTSVTTYSGFGSETSVSGVSASSGVLQQAINQAIDNVTGLNEAVAYYQSAGAGVTADNSKFETEVVNKIQGITPNGNDANSNGFDDGLEATAATAQTNLNTAQSALSTVLADSASTQADIAAAQANVDVAQSAFSGSVQAMYNSYNNLTPANKDNLLGAVLNGSWERRAIDSQSTQITGNTDAIATANAAIAQETSDRVTADLALESDLATEVATRESLIRQEADGSIHIGANSLVTNEVGGEQQLYAQDAGGNPININVTNGSDLLVNGVSVATDADVAAEASIRSAADTTLQNNINAEAATRASEDTLIRADIAAEAATRSAADTQLQANINSEVANRIADVNAEEQRATAAEAALAGRATAVENRTTALESRTGALEGRLGNVERDVRGLRKGIAMAAALQTPIIEAGKKNAVKFGVAAYDGEQGLGLGYARRITDSVQVNVDVATGFPETVARGGLNFSF